MKKIIAIVLTLAMVLSLCACGKKADDDKMVVPVPTQAPELAITEPPVTEAPIETEPVVEETVTPDGDKQAYWEKEIMAGNFNANMDSCVMTIDGILTMKMLSDVNGKELISTVSGDGSTGAEMYKVDEEHIYFHQFAPASEEEGTEAVDTWALCTIEEGEDLMSSSSTTSTIDEDLNTIKKVEYVETVDGLDHIILYSAAEEETEDGDWITSFDASYEIQYNGLYGQFRYTESTPVEGEGTSRITAWENEIEGMELFDYEFDKDALTLTKGDEVVECALVEDHMNADASSELIAMHAYIDAATHNVKKMTAEQDGLTMSFEFVEVDDVATYVDMPAEVTETIAGSEASMIQGFMMFGLIMSAAADMGQLG